jgi:hypothetical protein
MVPALNFGEINLFPTVVESTQKDCAKLRYAQKVAGARLDHEVADANYYCWRKSVVEMGKADKRAKKLQKKIARKAA